MLCGCEWLAGGLSVVCVGCEWLAGGLSADGPHDDRDGAGVEPASVGVVSAD